MNRRFEQSLLGMALALGLAGCATTEPRPTGGTGGDELFGCERIPFTGKIELKSPKEWTPEKAERGYLHIRFFVDRGSVYAVGFPVANRQLGNPFYVGPMNDLAVTLPPGEAHEYLKDHRDWREFYHKLFHAFGDSRPLAVVCPGPDCPTTPEGPPPGGFGMTATVGPGPSGLLLPSRDMPRLAALEMQAGGKPATDAAAVPAEGRPPDIDLARNIFSDTQSRALCVARIITPPPVAK